MDEDRRTAPNKWTVVPNTDGSPASPEGLGIPLLLLGLIDGGACVRSIYRGLHGSAHKPKGTANLTVHPDRKRRSPSEEEHKSCWAQNMRTAFFTIAAVLAGLIGGVANRQSDPNPPGEISIYSYKSGWTLATNAARMALSLTGPRPDPKKVQEEKLEGEAPRAAAVDTHTPEEGARIKERIQVAATAAPKASANSPSASRIVSSEKSDESRKPMLGRQLSELQAQRRWIEEEEYSLRFAVVEIERNAR